jgi:hypothetical protein
MRLAGLMAARRPRGQATFRLINRPAHIFLPAPRPKVLEERGHWFSVFWLLFWLSSLD